MKMLHFKKAENFLKTAKRTKNLSVFQKIDLRFAFKIKAFFVYCKVVKEKEYSSFLNR